MPAQFFWNDSWLRAASDKAFKQAAYGVKARMEATKPAKSIPVKGPFFGAQVARAARGVRTGRGEVAVIKSGGLAPIFEKGAKPHDIFPGAVKTTRSSYSRKRGVTTSNRTRRGGKKALKLGDGFAAHVRHPGMRAQPFMGPAASMFGTLYKVALSRFLPRPKFR
jgi:hypothetical protein